MKLLRHLRVEIEEGRLDCIEKHSEGSFHRINKNKTEEEKRDGYPVAYLTFLRIISTGLTGWAEIDVIHVIFNSVHTSHSQHVTATLIYFSLSSWFSSSPPRVKNQKSHDDFLKENFLSWNQFIFLFFTHHINLLRLKKATRHVLTNLLPLGLAPSDL